MVSAKTMLAVARRTLAAKMPSHRSPSKEMILCLWQAAGQLHAAEIDENGKMQLVDCSSTDATRKGRRPIVALLPKSQYLVKTVDVPVVTPQELPAMLRLEAEASLPPEFGQAEVSFFQLPPDSARDGRARFEVYIARDESLRKLIESLGSVGLVPDMILPSAVAWRGVLASRPEAGMLVVELPGEEMETVAGHDGGGCHVRTVESHSHGHAIAPGVVESIRSLMAAGKENDHHTVLWCGPSCPPHSLGSVRFEEALGSGVQVVNGAAVLALAWRGIGRLPAVDLRTASLSPAGQEETKRKLVARKRIIISIAALALGLLLIQASLWILSARCRTATAELDRRIALIRREGETTETRLKQLSAVAAASSRQDEFQQLIAAFYEYTPSGVSYSEIAMDESGHVRLHGQALSMGQPFLLPSALEGKGPLSRVVVKSAGLSKTGGGTITEFKAELMIKREAKR